MNKVTAHDRKFSISYDGQSVVTVRQDDDGDFDDALSKTSVILSFFHMSKPGNIWGCDGIGYIAEKERGKAFQHKSGVGRIKFQQGLDKLAERYGGVR